LAIGQNQINVVLATITGGNIYFRGNEVRAYKHNDPKRIRTVRTLAFIYHEPKLWQRTNDDVV
jgi:hypothetical protein